MKLSRDFLKRADKIQNGDKGPYIFVKSLVVSQKRRAYGSLSF